VCRTSRRRHGNGETYKSSASAILRSSSFDHVYSAWRVGLNKISFTSISSGWLMANATARANDSAGSAMSSTLLRTVSATSDSVMLFSNSVATEPGEITERVHGLPAP